MQRKIVNAIAAAIAEHTAPDGETWREFAERINTTSGWTVETSAPLGGVVRREGVVLSEQDLDDAIAQGIRWVAESRVGGSGELYPYRDIIWADWREANHAEWVATAPTAEIVSWAKAIKAQQ